jgi:copper chaperone CopZ
MRQATLHIEGMSCGHCLNAVNRALSAVPGVQIEAIRIGRADVSYDEGTTGPTQLEAAVAGAGYRATAQKEERREE